MIRADYTQSTHIFLAYPKSFYNEYESLQPFFNNLIELIPNEIHQFIITSTKKVANEIGAKFKHKNLTPITIPYWDEIWLRDCMGIIKGNQVVKPIYFPNYCNLKIYWNYFNHLNKLSKEIIKASIGLQVKELPLILDGGNFVNTSKLAVLTDKVLKDNPGKKVEALIKDYLDVQPIIIKQSKDDVIGHTDGYVAFLDEKTALASTYPSKHYFKSDNLYSNYLKET